MCFLISIWNTPNGLKKLFLKILALTFPIVTIVYPFLPLIFLVRNIIKWVLTFLFKIFEDTSKPFYYIIIISLIIFIYGAVPLSAVLMISTQFESLLLLIIPLVIVQIPKSFFKHYVNIKKLNLNTQSSKEQVGNRKRIRILEKESTMLDLILNIILFILFAFVCFVFFIVDHPPKNDSLYLCSENNFSDTVLSNKLVVIDSDTVICENVEVAKNETIDNKGVPSA